MLRSRQLAGVRPKRPPLPATSLARRPSSGRRAFLLAALFGLVGAPYALAGETECDALPESKRELCWMVVACGAMESQERREECFRVAAETLQAPEGDRAPPAENTQTRIEEDRTPIEEDRTPSATTAPAAIPTVTENTDEPTASEAPKRRRWFRWRKRPKAVEEEAQEVVEEPPPAAPTSAIVTETVAREVLTIPRRFSATVTAHTALVRDRQLLVLDDKLLFEADNRRSAAIVEGARVDVVKASSMRGRSFQIVGPSRRAVSALRIRCEDSDLTRETRRKCALLDRGDTSD